MSPKTMFIILGVLVVLFVAGVVMGVGQGDKEPQALSPAWLASLGSTLFKEQQLKVEDLLPATTPACRNQFAAGLFTLNAGASCNLYFDQSNAPVRQVSLRLAQGSSATVTFVPYDDNQITTHYEMTQESEKACKTVSAYQKGGWLAVQCTSLGTACQLEVVSTCQ